MSISQVTISNEALAELRERPITAMDEQSYQAQECSRQYPLVLAEMLEAHEWGFAIRRVTLASVTNDRASEWTYAYALPEIGTPIAVISPTAASALTLGPWPWRLDQWRRSYIIEGETIYTWVEGAILAYGAKDITPDKMPAMFRRALALGMAARMARTLRDDARLKAELQDEARLALERAMADDKNRQPQGEDWGDVASVRAGGDMTMFPPRDWIW